MRIRTLPAALAIALVAACFAPAQVEKLDRKAALEQFHELANRQLDRSNMRQAMRDRNEAMREWLETVRSVDLGEHEFTKAIARYFAGEYGPASEDLWAYHKKHKKFPVSDYDMIAGRIFLNGIAIRARDGDFSKVPALLPLAARYYNRPAGIYRSVGLMAKRAKNDAGNEALAIVTTAVLKDDRLDGEAKLEILTGIYTYKPRTRAAGGPKPWKTFTAKTMKGDDISPEHFKGKVLLIDYWATWCGPCMREMPNLARVHAAYKDRGFAVLGVSLDKENAGQKIEQAKLQFKMTWPQIYDGKGWEARLAKLNGVRSIPATFLFDRTGKLRYTGVRGEELERKVKELLAEKTPMPPKRRSH